MANEIGKLSDQELDDALARLRNRPIAPGPDAAMDARLIASLNERSARTIGLHRYNFFDLGALTRKAVAAVLMLALGGAVFWVAGHHDSTARADEIQTVQIQVSALRMLHDLHATTEQIRAVKNLASDTQASSNNLEGSDPHASGVPTYSSALKGLKDALLSDDDDKIESAENKVDDLEDKHDIDPDPGIDSTETARGKANDAVKLFSPGQIASYIAANGDDFPDPTQTLLTALNDSRGGPADDFVSLRDDTAQQVGSLIGGPQGKRSKPIIKSVTDLLNKVRDLSDSDFASQKSDLEKSAREITAVADPVDVIRHWMHFQMADLLSNPQLGEVLSEKLDHPGH